MQLEKQKRFIIHFLYFAIILGVVILIARYALGVLMPFITALLVSLLLKPAVTFFHEKWKMPRKLTGLLLVVVFYAVLGLLLIVIGVRLFAAAKTFFVSLPSVYTYSIVPWVKNVFASLQEFAARLDPDAAAAYDVVASNITTSLGDAVINASKMVVTWATNFTFKAPGFLLKVIITVISTVFLTIDFPRITSFVNRQLPQRWRELLNNARIQLGHTLWSYIRSYALILLITFGEIAIGLSIIGVRNAIGIAVAIAIFDILPVVGSGLVLLPWTIVTLISGNLGTGIGLAVVYIVVIVVRQIIEPKIVGDRVGLHPLVTILCMVLGTYLFGPVGLLGLPITVALIHALNKQGAIHLYKNDDKDSASSNKTSAPDSAKDDSSKSATPPEKAETPAKKRTPVKTEKKP